MRTKRYEANLFRLGLATLLVSALLAAPRPASANGRYPSAGLIAVDPADARHIVVRATYGMLTTRDAGQVWSWICEPAVGYGGFEDPMISFVADGTLIAGVFQGLSASKNGGCDWEFADGALRDKFVTDLAVDRADLSKAVLVISSGVGAGMFLTQLWETSDNATTWTQAGVDLPAEFLALTLDSAPSDPTRVYVTGRFGEPEYTGAIERTSDRGQTWERLDIPGSNDKALPYLSAIDPADSETLYVRLDSDPTDSLLVSRDGGQTFTTIFEGQGNLLGFALSPDGSTVLVGGEIDGVWRASTSSFQFEKVSEVGVRCLTWLDTGVYACADEFTDDFTAGLSQDEGATFTPILHLNGLCGPLECEATSDVATICTDLWGATKLAIAAECPTSASTGASGSGGGDAGGGGGDAGGAGPAPERDADSCACRAAGADPAASSGARAGWLAVAAAGAIAARRRRRSAQGAPKGASARAPFDDSQRMSR